MENDWRGDGFSKERRNLVATPARRAPVNSPRTRSEMGCRSKTKICGSLSEGLRYELL
jgi:hypothetical protein